MENLLTTSSSIKIQYKNEDKSSRGKFKAEIRELKTEEIKKILIEKIKEEESLIIENSADLEFIKTVKYKKDKFNVASLFSGAGGLDLGLELAGLSAEVGDEKAMQAFQNKREFAKLRSKSIFHTGYTNDMFIEANQSYKKNFPDFVKQHQKDIRKVAHFPKSEMMVGGFPCPGFSEAGPRLIDDPRNFLYIHFIRALMQAQPEFFVAENVKGMMTLGKGEVLKQIVEDFASAGYTVTPHLVNSRDYGVPQSRERVFLIGVHKEKIEQKYNYHYNLPEPTHANSNDLFSDKLPFVTLKEAIGDLEKNPGPYFEGSYSTIYMSRNRKKSWGAQSFTIQASGRQAPQHPAGMPMKCIEKNKWEFQGKKNRRLSVREIARIQTFPDWYEFSDGENEKISENGRLDKMYKQIGNAVPVLLAKAITQPIADFVKENIL
ncbi:MAG: DNA cytosine methyltransferase [Erysipelotrichales bacterium]|nr:DNA cytosine methyltransferase [Erysipelotrichales bacterium]MCL2676719.1 DNA cytosine methyltransferase [Streptococcaceae bacterium]